MIKETNKLVKHKFLPGIKQIGKDLNVFFKSIHNLKPQLKKFGEEI